MFSSHFLHRSHRFRACLRVLALLVLSLEVLVWQAFPAAAQDQSPSAQDPQKQETPPEAGGPQSDTGPYAIPKKKDEPPPPPPPERPKKIENMPDYSIKVDVPLVTVPVSVTTKDGQFIPNLAEQNFRVTEDGVPQTVTGFDKTPAPITAVLLVEFAATNYTFMYEAWQASAVFATQLQKEDWVAVISYDMKPHILTDFTQDKREVAAAVNTLRIPGFAETNLFDALYDTLDRVDRIEGRKFVILVTTGVDTFSKLNLDQAMKKIRATKDVTIFPISVGFAVRNYYESHGGAAPHGAGIPVNNMDYLQADNEMNTFAKMTGGRAYFPRFDAELPDIFHQIIGDIRNQYVLTYHPTNPKLDGSYRKLKVEVVAPDGGPLKMRDQKGKDVKYLVIAREGYTAKHTVD
jgi:VWFA-related protein